ncbi:MAG: T9SS type A sorting domain-containing protein, partial [Saprospiraceae bacterium]|nr:T9SS type A sorting domain-containing protein [Saprospiraceae bacterium]
GITDHIEYNHNLLVTANATYNQTNNLVSFNNASVNSTQFIWDFGDGNYSNEKEPTHLFAPGSYEITLIASNECDSDSLLLQIAITTGTIDGLDSDIQVFPNPTSGKCTISFKDPIKSTILVFNMLGMKISEIPFSGQVYELDLSNFPKGMYFIRVENNQMATLNKSVTIK